MPDALTRFDITVHDRVDRIQDRLRALRESAVPSGSELDARLDALGERLDASRDRLVSARNIVEDWVDVRADDIRDWRSERKVDKLLQQSEQSQRRAEAALDVALGALDEAELALTQAALAQDGAEEIAPERFGTTAADT